MTDRPLGLIDLDQLVQILPDLIADALRQRDARPPPDRRATLTKATGVVTTAGMTTAEVQLDEDEPGVLAQVQLANAVNAGDRVVVLISPGGSAVAIGNGDAQAAANSGAGVGSWVVIEADTQTAFGIGDDQQDIVWDNIYETDPSWDNLAGDIPSLPAELGLSGTSPFTFFEATENGLWLVTLTAILAATSTEYTSLQILGDFRDHCSPPIVPLSGDLGSPSSDDWNVTAMVALESGNQFWGSLLRDDDSAPYDGIETATVRILRLA